MNRLKEKILLLLLCSIALIPSAFSQTIHVSLSGKDSNPGTAKAPFATLEAARDQVRKLRRQKQLNGSVTIQVNSGTYYLTKPLEFTREDSGTASSALIIRGAAGKTPVLSGGSLLPSFQKVTEQLWKIDLPNPNAYGGPIQQLFINGTRAVRARTPNQDIFYKIKGVKETPGQTDSQRAVQKIPLSPDQYQTLQFPPGDAGNLIASIHHAWDRTRKYVDKIDATDTSLYISGKAMQPWNKLNNSAQFYFENKRSFLDQPGEFFFDPSGTLYYIPKPGETIKETTAIVPLIEQIAIIKGGPGLPVEHIQFENLSFQHTRHLMTSEGEEPMQAAAPTEATIMVDYASNIRFDKCEVTRTGNNGLWFRAGCQNNSVTDSYFHDLGIGGLKIGEMKIPADQSTATGHITIDNNIIRTGGQEIPTGIGVMIFQSADNVISHNEIADFRYTGISVGWVWGYAESPTKRNKIINNHIHHLGWGELSDMGGIYTLGRSEGTVVSGNVIHDIYSYGYGGWGLYTDEGSTGIVMENNLVYNCKNSGFHQHYGQGNLIRNNIFAFQIKAQLQASRVEKHQSFRFTRNIVYYSSGKLGETNWDKVNAVKDSNIYWNTALEKINTAKDQHAIVADPLFKNPLQYDFRIKNTSVIDKIGFQQFDYTKAGVYGSKTWKKLAAFNKALHTKFSETVMRLLKDDIKHP
ncbi:MAG: right-handed parallel beta-helix repeat-containing protein [Pedobacter sp.]|nr:MAG: right-handed parallel beta-helix repeat-containing protein [Pedobacter sp.]